MVGLGSAKLFVQAYTERDRSGGGLVLILFMVAGRKFFVGGMDFVAFPFEYEIVFVPVVGSEMEFWGGSSCVIKVLGALLTIKNENFKLMSV